MADNVSQPPMPMVPVEGEAIAEGTAQNQAGTDPWFQGGATNMNGISDINFFESALQQNAVKTDTRRLQVMLVGGTLLVLLLVGIVVYRAELMELAGLSSGSEDLTIYDTEEAGSKKKAVPQAPIDEVAEPATESDDFGMVSSEFKLPTYTPLRDMTEAERADYEARLDHKYTYQRFKAANELRKLKLGGSEPLLTRALDDVKFWTRMEGIFGLADMGADVKSEHVKKAIGSPRPYLVKSYFRRFLKESTEGERYVLALAMYFVDAEAQEVIGTALAPYRQTTAMVETEETGLEYMGIQN